MNVGYWLAHCEEWFQERLKCIMSNTAVLRSSTKWSSSLVQCRKEGKLATINEKHAATYLHALIGSK